ncbi:pre-rRNA-processing protein TSR1 homolog isoform X2 [Sitophilus oryzae]|uniref:Pre-rRNA-processing protein TSR1 homolog n=1 Tax=Sitophilus oryzae TaxID=7048 RepID=A0A6J2XAL2_SITOR|nr:pre-rRNA-processing protein TSR1 homolog isoform X2 [Sitophilus oryzae]
MAVDKGQTHRPGPFKQSNKEHKHGRHRSKGSISLSNKGKVSVKTLSKKHKHELERAQRRNQSQQIRKNKRDEVLAKKRSLGGLDFAPIFACLVPLNKGFDPTTALSILTQCDEEGIVSKTSTGVTHLCIPRFKKRFSFVVPSGDNDFDVLDTLKVADTVIFLLSSVFSVEDNEDIIDKWGNNIITTALAQGLPTPLVVLTDLESVTPKKRNEYKQAIQKIVSKYLPEEKLMTLDKYSEGINILRKIGDQKRKSVLYRDRRPYLYGEEIEFVPESEGAVGTLKITGYLKGTPLSVNQLVHIPGLGDYQMLQIDAPNDPNKYTKNKASDPNAMVVETTTKVLEISDPEKQESLDSENVPDAMDAEQTMPTDEDFQMANRDEAKKVKKVPKGWSDYQAAWIPDDDAEFQNNEYSGDEEESEDDEFMDARSEEKSEYSDAEDEKKEFDTVTESEIAVNDDKYDQEMDMNAEQDDLNKLKEAKSDLMFPDEVDTPVDTPARIRFQKYRGLESFRTSPWDTKENLPSDYSRIFQFQNFDRTKKRILKEQENKDGALPGWYVTVHVKNVSELMWSSFLKTKSPVILFGLFPHEHKMSVLNAVLKRTQDYGFPIKSKERVIFQCGFRRFITNPIFSQHTNGQKHKFERFFQPNSTTVATFYAPIQFPPAPILCYKQIGEKYTLVATGNLLSCNPDRLVIKRIVLSGHPFKIYKKSAVVRFMFFNRDDITYFKPCKLRTKMGRKGHIKEPLGTHGHMKCGFDGQLKSQDTVMLNLYKRVFPKWTYEDFLVSCVNNDTMET